MATAVPVSLVWFRLDLRTGDNPALIAAARRGPVVPVFVWCPEEEGRWPPGAASRWWLHQSLTSLERDLRDLGSRLILRTGPTLAVLRELIAATGADAVFWNRRYEPAVIQRDTAIKTTLREDGILVESFNSHLLFEPWTIKTKERTPYKVFTPFWRACQAVGEVERGHATPGVVSPPAWPAGLPLEQLGLQPAIDWAAGMRTAWRPGRRGAEEQLTRFLDEALANYDEGRDRPDMAGTSRLSPHLHFGEISPRRIWHALAPASVPRSPGGDREKSRKSVERYRAELGWREFAHHLLFHFPHTSDEPLRPEFARFPWQADRSALRAWQRGRTGYPIVDAGMRELWTTGWMHNRVRMIAASFLVKDLQIAWQEGAKWFWDTLVDADLASNSLGWQWTAGCGADAAPYFRIFNPITQGQRFDPNGSYVRCWVPELAQLPTKWLHQPWAAPLDVLAAANIKLGTSYPVPIVDHAVARKTALEAFANLAET